jgi:hypothetical protein
MPFEALRVIPSVDIERTLADNAQGVSDSNFIRWRDKIPEKRGGCQLYANIQFNGYVTDLHAWQGLNNNKFLGIGSTTNLYVYSGTNSREISPRYETVSITPDISSTSGFNIFEVTDATFAPASTYDAVVFNTPVSIAGVILNGAYEINQLTGPTSYNIVATDKATSTVSNGGVLPQFTVSTGSSVVTVNFPDHTFLAGQLVSYPVPTDVGGITIYGSYVIDKVIAGVSFTFLAQNTATFSDSQYMNYGDLSLTYWITIGPLPIGAGYGLGGYGLGGYGTGSSPPTPNNGSIFETVDYYLDNWGETLIISPEGAPIFYWSPISGYQNAAMITNSPLQNNGAFVAMPQQQVMAWGSTYNSLSDPLQIRWSDVGNYNDWTPTVTNQAGGYHIPTGSIIRRGFQGPSQQYWWTDIDLYVAQYTGPPFVYGFSKIGTGCGLIASKGVAQVGSTVYWMSQKQFFMVSGSNAPQPIPCSVWDYVFQNLDWNNVDNIEAAPNSQFNEISWFFPSVDSPNGENDSYVCYNVLYNEWDVGKLARTAWIDQSVLTVANGLHGPIGAGTDGYIYMHETSNDLAGQPINASFKTGYFSLTNGNDLVFVDWALPDMKWGQYSQAQTAQVKITFNVTEYAGQEPTAYGPFVFTKSTPYIEPRFRGRFVQIVVESDDAGSFWRLGSIRYRYSTSGRR